MHASNVAIFNGETNTKRSRWFKVEDGKIRVFKSTQKRLMRTLLGRDHGTTKEIYRKEIAPKLQEELKLANVMEVPRIAKSP